MTPYRGAVVLGLITVLVGGAATPAAAATVGRDDAAPWLAFSSQHRSSPSAINSLAANGEFRRLTSADAPACAPGEVVSVGVPRWSPDGSMVSFIQVVVTSDDGCADRVTESRLVVMHADGSDERSLVAHRQGIEQAGWAPDGSLVYFVRGELDGLWSVEIDGSDPERINSMEGWQEVSPAGGRVAVITSDEPLEQALIVAAIDGSGASVIGPVGPYATGRELRWSPDGRWLTAVRANHHNKLLLIRADGSERRVVWRGRVHGLDYSPGGGKLVVGAYEADQWDDVWVIDLASGSSRAVTKTNRRTESDPTWRARR